MKAKEIMVTNIATIEPDKNIVDAAKIMKGRRIGSLVVVKGSKPIGIITERDIVRKLIAEGKDAKNVKVKDLMSYPLITASPDDDVEVLAKRMSKNEIRRLPVVDNDGRLVGMITATDIAKSVVKDISDYDLVMRAILRYHKEGY
jgi:CBS domain-containing protein